MCGIVGWSGVGKGRDLHIDQVSFLDYFIYKAGNALMIFLFHCEKATHDTTDLRISFFLIVDAPCAYMWTKCISETLCNHIQNI